MDTNYEVVIKAKMEEELVVEDEVNIEFLKLI